MLRQEFDTGEQTEWHLNQEIEFSLGLVRRKDIWVRPEEDYAEVVRLKRDPEGRPQLIEIKAEHLRDYLCARKASILVTGFECREAIERSLDEIDWKEDQRRSFANGEWVGTKRAIFEGGRPVGVKTAVIRLWRESVDPSSDVPMMPHLTERARD